MLFPANKINNKMTINGFLGLNRNIRGFDITLECIRQFYFKLKSPLSETFDRYTSFLDLFQNFKGYGDFSYSKN